ncbi:MAG: hypothetical protein ABRQ26_07150 [Syntrophomonadaceae bacterium]
MSEYYERKKPAKQSKRGKGVDCYNGKSLKIEIINNIPQPFPLPSPPPAPTQPINLEIQQAANQDVQDIQSTVSVLTSVMTDIKSDVNVITDVMTDIQSDVNVMTSVVSETKTEVDVITSVVTDLVSDVNVLTAAVTSPTTGLEEIQREVNHVEGAVLSPDFGLEALAADLINTNTNVYNVRNEIIGRVNDIGPGRAKLTSGPWIASSQYLEIRVLNTTDSRVGPISVTAYDLDQNPRAVLLRNPIPTPITATFYIPSNSSKTISFMYDMNGDFLESLVGKVLELEFSGLSEGVYVYSRTTDATRASSSDVLNSYCFI